MHTRAHWRICVIAAIAATVAACDASGPSARGDSQFIAALAEIENAVSGDTGYSAEAIEITANPAHLRVSIGDAKLAEADQAVREDVARKIAVAVEDALASQRQLSTVQVISIAIVHVVAKDGAGHRSHIEDVVEFRKGADQRFALHIT